MTSATPATYGLLGMLAVRPWTGYELTRQVRRSLRFIWPVSEGHLYREQQRLVELGWATVELEAAGRRSRKRYTITEAGRVAMREWLGTSPGEPQLQIEGVLRTFFGDQGDSDSLVRSMKTTATMARSMLSEMHGFVEEYLEEGGPLTMLEQDIGGTAAERLEFHDRKMFPERLHVVALAIDVTSQLLQTLDTFFDEASAEVASWPHTASPSITPSTRRRLEQIQSRLSDQLGRSDAR